MILSYQSIKAQVGMITPMVERTLHSQSGMTYGLGPCSYDVRIAQDVRLFSGRFKLASTVEQFDLPANVCGHVRDKSSLARVGLAVQNTHLDPGWRGYLTLELTNHGFHVIDLYEGQPIAQIVLEWLDHETELPYVGKYQNQRAGPVPAIQESE